MNLQSAIENLLKYDEDLQRKFVLPTDSCSDGEIEECETSLSEYSDYKTTLLFCSICKKDIPIDSFSKAQQNADAISRFCLKHSCASSFGVSFRKDNVFLKEDKDCVEVGESVDSEDSFIIDSDENLSFQIHPKNAKRKKYRKPLNFANKIIVISDDDDCKETMPEKLFCESDESDVNKPRKFKKVIVSDQEDVKCNIIKDSDESFDGKSPRRRRIISD